MLDILGSSLCLDRNICQKPSGRPAGLLSFGLEVALMPMAPPSRCGAPGCKRLAKVRGRCEDHPPKAWANPSRNTQGLTRDERFAFAREVLRDSPPCACTGWCGTHHGPCQSDATEADHIISLGEGGSRLASANGQGLCTLCHRVKSQAEAARGKQRRRRPR